MRRLGSSLSAFFNKYLDAIALLGVAPKVFDGIEFGSIAWETLYPNAPSGRGKVIGHHLGAVCGQAIPDHQQVAQNMLLEMF